MCRVLRIRLGIQRLAFDVTKLRIDIEDMDLEWSREVVIALYKPGSLHPFTHIHVRRSRARLCIEIPCIPRLRVEVYLCRVVSRRPPLHSDIVIHRDPAKPRVLVAELGSEKLFVELLPGAGLHLEKSSPVLRKGGSILAIERTVVSKQYRLLCIRSRFVRNIVARLARVFMVRDLCRS